MNKFSNASGLFQNPLGPCEGFVVSFIFRAIQPRIEKNHWTAHIVLVICCPTELCTSLTPALLYSVSNPFLPLLFLRDDSQRHVGPQIRAGAADENLHNSH